MSLLSKVGPNLELAPQLMLLRLLHTPEVSRSAKTFAAAQVPATLEVSRSKSDIGEWSGAARTAAALTFATKKISTYNIVLYCNLFY